MGVPEVGCAISYVQYAISLCLNFRSQFDIL